MPICYVKEPFMLSCAKEYHCACSKQPVTWCKSIQNMKIHFCHDDLLFHSL